jgi:transketolase
MRSAFSKNLVAAATADPKILLLTGDHGYSLFDDFRRARPDQFLNAGIAEQNMVGMAAGLAKAGFKPVVYGLSAFVPVRVLEQIKIDVCYEDLPVVFIGDGAGLVYSSLGTSHQSTEDIAVLRAIPKIQILSPCDALEMDYAMTHALQFRAPVYLRMGKSDIGEVHSVPLTQPLGDLIPVRPGSDRQTVFLATGSMVKTATRLAEHFGEYAVWSVPSIIPINHEQIVTLARDSQHIVVLEEHSVSGGLGGAIAEIVAEMRGNRARVIRLGVRDKFSEFCGSYEYLCQEHGIDLDSLKLQLKGQLE